MRAIVYSKYGSPDVLELRDIAKPVVKDDEVLVKIHAASANPADWHYMRGAPYLVRLVKGFRKPRHTSLLGLDMAGQVELVGKDVTRFAPGDEVFGEVGTGSFAEYISFPETKLCLKPSNLTFEQAAAVPLVALTALQALRDKGHIAPDHWVLVNGASGGVGSFAVQIAKVLGAEVTAVCSTRNMEWVRSLGADHVIDYTKEDFTHSPQSYDLIIDTVGSHSLLDFRRALVPKGRFVAVGAGNGQILGPAAQMLRAILMSPFVSQKMTGVSAKADVDDLNFIKELIEAGKISPVIDSTYPLAEVPEAIRHLEEGHAQGKIVITV